jgi:hypothetical protein
VSWSDEHYEKKREIARERLGKKLNHFFVTQKLANFKKTQNMQTNYLLDPTIN